MYKADQHPHALNIEKEAEVSNSDKAFKMFREKFQKTLSKTRNGKTMSVDAVLIELMKKGGERKGERLMMQLDMIV